jgi:hypothetical protein
VIPAYLIYRAERTKTTAEQRAAAVRSSELVAASAQLFRSFSEPLRALCRAVQLRPVRLAAGRTVRPAGCREDGSWPAGRYS